MADQDAPSTMLEEAPASTEEMTDLIPLACILRDKLDELLAGTREAPGMRSILQFAAPHLVALRSECFSSKNPVGYTRRKGFKRLAVEGGPACGHICPQHPAQLDPAVWSHLPEELLELIFVKLPVPEIHRLRCLSKPWQRNMVEKSRFTDLCAKTNSKIFALISEDIDWCGMFWVKLYDINTNKWHVFKLFVGTYDEPFQTMSAADGGLVCFISAWETTKEYPLQIVICNPLTQHVRSFVLEGLSTHQVEMLQIVTNCDTGHFKLIVAGRKQIPLRDAPNYVHVVVDLFDSQTEEWISLDFPAEDQPFSRDLYWGIRYNWDWEGLAGPDYMPESHCLGPCVWDCAELELNELNDDDNPVGGVSVEDYALLRDRLFVLHEESRRCFVSDSSDSDDQGNVDGRDNVDDSDNSDDNDADDVGISRSFMMDHYCISEYSGQTRQPNWVKLRTISCSPFKFRPSTTDYRMRLHACEGFLLVVAYNDEWDSPYDHEIGWLYDLSTDEWRALPSMPGGVKLQDIKDSLLCELRWDMDLNPLNVDAQRCGLLPVCALSECF